MNATTAMAADATIVGVGLGKNVFVLAIPTGTWKRRETQPLSMIEHPPT
jgi:hypothetical protein